jgi:hypothetical protein
MKESAAKDSSTIQNPAKPPTEGRRNNYLQMKLRESREENTRLNNQLNELIADPDLRSAQLQNETLKAVIEGHLFKERMTEIVREVLFTELDGYLDLRFSKGAVYRDEAIEEVRARLQELSTNKPENKHGR